MTSKPEMLFQRYSIDYIFKDYCGRRTALVLALTEGFEELFKQCNQDMDYNVCLYGYPNETWIVTRPEKEVRPSLLVPVRGINFSKEKDKPRAWRCQVAVHSDSWLLSVAFSLGNHLNEKERKLLFKKINKHPTVFEAVTNWKLRMEKRTVDSVSGRKRPKISKRSGDVKIKSRLKFAYEGNKEDKDNQNICGGCGGNGNSGDEFWILCDICERWFHMHCVQITPEVANRIDQYKCPTCSIK